MPHLLAQQRMTLIDPEWPFHWYLLSPHKMKKAYKMMILFKELYANVSALHIVHAKINIIRIARYLYSSRVSCFLC